MGDEGKLYNGIGEETVALMRELIATADYIVPNYTEAAYLAGVPYQCGGTTREELYALADKLHALGAGSVLITSARMLVDGGWGPIACVVGYDAAADQHFILPYEELPVRFPGTGDIFSAVFMGHILRGDTLKTAAQAAMQTVSKMLAQNADNQDKYKGIPLETCLEDVVP